MRPTEIATLVAGALVLLLSALPTFAPATKSDMVRVAVAVLVYAVVWHHVVPPGFLGRWRLAAGASILQVIAAFLIATTGGSESPFFSFALIPVFASVFARSLRATAIVATTGLVSLVAMWAIGRVGAGSIPAEARDIALARLAAFAAACVTALLVARAHERAHRDLVRAYAEREREALIDPLTGLGNRRLLEREMDALQARAERGDVPYAAIALDLDHLKHINDAAGHPAGDAALRAVGQAIRDCVRPYDVGARLGGDEFVILIVGVSEADARSTAERVRDRADEIASDLLPGVALSMSTGIASWQPGMTVSEVLARADGALYDDKRVRRDRRTA